MPIKPISDVLFKDGDIYCAAGSGLFILDQTDFTYRRVTQIEGFPDQAALTLENESENSILVATERPGDTQVGTGLYRYSIDTGDWQKIEFEKSSYYGWPYIVDMERDSNGTIWGSSYEFFFQVVGNEVVIMEEDSGLPVNDNYSRSIATDVNGNILVTYYTSEGSGITRLTNDTWVTILEMPERSISNLTVAPDNTIWFRNKGLVWSYDGITLLSFDLPHVGSYFTASCIAATSDNIIWCTGRDTLVRISDNNIEDMSTDFQEALESRIAPYSFLDYKTIFANDDEAWVIAYCRTADVHFEVLGKYENNEWIFYIPEYNLIYPYSIVSPSEIVVDNDGTLWMTGSSMFPESVVSFDGATWSYHSSNFPYDIALDGLNRIWTFGSGAKYYDNGQWTVFSQEDYPIFDDILRVGDASSSSAWMGDGYGNVYRYEFDGEWTKFPAAEVGTRYISSIIADDRWGIWIDRSSGVAHYENEEWTMYTGANSGLPSNKVKCISCGKNGVVWFATDSGLASFDGDEWEVFTLENSGLPDNDVLSVLAARNGDIWIETRGGLCRYDGEMWETFEEEFPPLLKWYDSEIAEAPDGSIWFTGMGLRRYIPDTGTMVKNETAFNPTFIEMPNIYPNPFNPTTTIEFVLPKAGMAALTIYNIGGQKVRELLSGQKSAGKHSIAWDGRDESGKAVSAGVYIAHLKAGGMAVTRKMVLVR